MDDSQLPARPHRGLVSLALLAGLAFALYSAVCLLARRHWLGELAANWRWYAGLFGLGVPALLLLARRRRLALGALALALWHLAPALALELGASSSTSTGGPALRVASANLLWRAATNDDLRAWLARERFDVVALQELDLTRLAILDALAADYPHQLLDPPERADWNRGASGQAILSRHPIEASASHYGGWRGQPFLEASVRVGADSLTLLAAHPTRPGRTWRIEARNAALAALARRARGRERVVVLGDLNATLYSPAFRDLLEVGELRDSRAGHGRQGSWRAHGWLFGFGISSPFRLGIDHVLVGRGLEVRARALGPDLGSDHLPVVAELAWRELAASTAGEVNARAAAPLEPAR